MAKRKMTPVDRTEKIINDIGDVLKTSDVTANEFIVALTFLIHGTIMGAKLPVAETTLKVIGLLAHPPKVPRAKKKAARK